MIPEIDWYTDRRYAIRYSFNADVPSGIDPHYAPSLSGGFVPATAAVPLPGALVLFGLGAPLLLALKRSNANSST